MTRTEAKDAARDLLLKLAPFLVAGGIGWGTLKAEVNTKADKSVVESDHTLLVEMNSRQQKIEKMLCKLDRTDCDAVQP